MASTPQSYYIVNDQHAMFLDTHGRDVSVWNNGGKDVNTVIAQNTSRNAGNIRWMTVECPHQPGTAYLVNVGHRAFLDTHGQYVSLWNAGGRDIPDIIAGNTSQYAGNIRWQLIPCPNQPGTYYIVNSGHVMFLDSRGIEGECLTVSNNGGKSVETVIEEDASRRVGNIRWALIPIEGTPVCAPIASLREKQPAHGYLGGSAAPPPAPQMSNTVRIVHLSDTHNLHREIEAKFPVPEGDILIHTGDFSDHGSPAEIADFDAWLGEVGQRFRHVILIPGNHDWWHTIRQGVTNGAIDPHAAVSPGFMQQKFRNCRVLINEEIVVDGLRIFGSSWAPWQKDGNPDKLGGSHGHVQTSTVWARNGESLDSFEMIPDGIDILLTHGPAADIMDCVGNTNKGRGWGSSQRLLQAILRAKPRAHLFGHLHEQRGLWTKTASGYEGGIEYIVPGESQPFRTIGPPPRDYPCELVSCNAMCSHPGLDGTGRNQIAGPARVIHMAPRRQA